MKNDLLRILLLTVPIVAFNVLFFLIGGTQHPTSVWVAYGAIHLAWLVCLATPVMFNKLDHPVNTYLLTALTAAFYLLQFVVGIIIILIAPQSHVWPLIIEVLLFAIFLIALVGIAWSNSLNAADEKKRVANKRMASDHALRMKLLSSQQQDPQLRLDLMKCYDRMMRTPIKNTPEVGDVNDDIDAVLAKMERPEATTQQMGQALAELLALVERREQMLKFNH